MAYGGGRRGLSGQELGRRFREGDLPIQAIESELPRGVVVINPFGLLEGGPEAIVKRVWELAGAPEGGWPLDCGPEWNRI